MIHYIVSRMKKIYTLDQIAMDVFSSKQHVVCLNPNNFGKCTWRNDSFLDLEIININGTMPELHVNFSSLGVSRFWREHKTKGLGFLNLYLCFWKGASWNDKVITIFIGCNVCAIHPHLKPHGPCVVTLLNRTTITCYNEIELVWA